MFVKALDQTVERFPRDGMETFLLLFVDFLD